MLAIFFFFLHKSQIIQKNSYGPHILDRLESHFVFLVKMKDDFLIVYNFGPIPLAFF